VCQLKAYTIASLHWLLHTFKNHHDNYIISNRCNIVHRITQFSTKSCIYSNVLPYLGSLRLHCRFTKAFASGKTPRSADITDGLKRNTREGRKWEASGYVIPTTNVTTLCGVRTVTASRSSAKLGEGSRNCMLKGVIPKLNWRKGAKHNQRAVDDQGIVVHKRKQ